MVFSIELVLSFTEIDQVDLLASGLIDLHWHCTEFWGFHYVVVVLFNVSKCFNRV